VSPKSAEHFAACVTEWIQDHGVTPIYLSGLPAEKGDVPDLSGIATGGADGLLAEAEIDAPEQDGAITGPTGALIYEAERRDLASIGLVVESNRQFPDPEAARAILLNGVEPLTGVEVETDSLVEQAEEISEAKSQLAQQMQQASDESTSAEPLGMYQMSGTGRQLAQLAIVALVGALIAVIVGWVVFVVVPTDPRNCSASCSCWPRHRRGPHRRKRRRVRLPSHNAAEVAVEGPITATGAGA